MKYFLDTEFIETVGHIELISIGIVSEDGRELYMANHDANLDKAASSAMRKKKAKALVIE